jgi:replicative DNA helicase
MGKSGLIISSLRQTAAKGFNALLFSLEASAESVTDRMLSDTCYSTRSPIHYFDIARGGVTNEQAEAIIDAKRAMRSLSIKIDPQGGLAVGQIAARARRYKQQLERHGKTLDVLAVDHLHIVKASNRYSGNRVAEITEISAGLKSLAKELNVPLIALAQLSREPERRDDKRPMLADLRDSGSLEQDADVIIFVYREAYYLERIASADAKQEEGVLDALAQTRNDLEATIAKQRNGPTGTVTLFCNIACNAIRDRARIAE